MKTISNECWFEVQVQCGEEWHWVSWAEDIETLMGEKFPPTDKRHKRIVKVETRERREVVMTLKDDATIIPDYEKS